MFRELCILVAIWVMGSQAENLSAEMREIAESCRIEQNITEAEHLDLQNNWSANINAATVERRLKCYLDCFLEGLEVFDESGQIDLDKYYALSMLDESSTRDGLTKCRTSQASLSDPCEYAFGLYNCIMELKAAL